MSTFVTPSIAFISAVAIGCAYMVDTANKDADRAKERLLQSKQTAQAVIAKPSVPEIHERPVLVGATDPITAVASTAISIATASYSKPVPKSRVYVSPQDYYYDGTTLHEHRLSVPAKGWTSDYFYRSESEVDAIERYVGDQFVKAGYSRKLGLIMLRVESKSGRMMIPRIKRSKRCLGFFQFCPKTAKSMKVKDPFSLVDSTAGAIRLVDENVRVLSNYGVPKNDLHLYLSHVLGPASVDAIVDLKAGRKLTKRQRGYVSRSIATNWHPKWMGKRSYNSKDFHKVYQGFERIVAKYGEI